MAKQVSDTEWEIEYADGDRNSVLDVAVTAAAGCSAGWS